MRLRRPSPWATPAGRTSSVLAAAAALVVCTPVGLADTATTPSYAPPRPWADRQAAPTAVAAAARPPVAAPPSRPRAANTALPARSGSGRRIVYSIDRQRVWLVGGNNRVQRSYLVSGRRSEPGPGTYRVFSKSLHARSSVSPHRMKYMVRFTHGPTTAIGFHSIPVELATGRPAQTLRQLGQPLSHGCIRQRHQDAVALWRFAPVGTKVVITR